MSVLAQEPSFLYQRHRPEDTLLYQIVERYYPDFKAKLLEQGTVLPYHVDKEFYEFLQCGRLENGFLRVVCHDCKHEKLVAFSCKKRGLCPSCGARRMVESAKLLVDDVLGDYPVRQWVLSFPIALRLLLARYPTHLSKVLQIVHRAISTDIVHRSGYLKKQAKTGAVTHIQRFGSALNLNVHLHMLFLEGVITTEHGQTVFRRCKAPSHTQMEELLHVIRQRLADYLEKAGIIEKDIEATYLSLPIDDDNSLLPLQAASVHYRVAIGPQQGQKIFQLQTVPARDDKHFGQLVTTNGFSFHAATFVDAHQPKQLEKLCRYIARPAISEARMAFTEGGKVRYELKTPFSDGTTHVFFDPVDFIGKLAALIPPPRLNLIRFYGVFAPNSSVRAEVTPSKRGRNSPKLNEGHSKDKSYHAQAMTWAKRLKRVFNIEINECESCHKHNVRVISCITEPVVIDKILTHLDQTFPAPAVVKHLPPHRGPPQQAPGDHVIQRDFNWGA